jgi:hypothetical protein
MAIAYDWMRTNDPSTRVVADVEPRLGMLMAYSIRLRIIGPIAALCMAATVTTELRAQQKAAAETPSENGSVLQEIIVTAQKRVESVQNVPISITTLSGTAMSDANVSVQSQLPLVTTNLQINVNSDYVAPWCDLRREVAIGAMGPERAPQALADLYPGAQPR